MKAVDITLYVKTCSMSVCGKYYTVALVAFSEKKYIYCASNTDLKFLHLAAD